MINALKSRWVQGHRTIDFPNKIPALSPRFLGRPDIQHTPCAATCRECADLCPVEAIRCAPDSSPTLDLGRCIFCAECARHCPQKAISFTQRYEMAASSREDLIRSAASPTAIGLEALESSRRVLFKRSLKLRQVSAGGCNACEADVNVLNTLAFDLGRFGIQFVAAPRHADGLLITGPVTDNMKIALEKTYQAVPSPKVVIAVGACAISGGLYADHPETQQGADGIVPVDLYIPGCPPNPLTILDGLLRFLDRIA